jgi:hydroxymethylglutaryl-CoA reductase (NADPH)
MSTIAHAIRNCALLASKKPLLTIGVCTAITSFACYSLWINVQSSAYIQQLSQASSTRILYSAHHSTLIPVQPNYPTATDSVRLQQIHIDLPKRLHTSSPDHIYASIRTLHHAMHAYTYWDTTEHTSISYEDVCMRQSDQGCTPLPVLVANKHDAHADTLQPLDLGMDHADMIQPQAKIIFSFAFRDNGTSDDGLNWLSNAVAHASLSSAPLVLVHAPKYKPHDAIYWSDLVSDLVWHIRALVEKSNPVEVVIVFIAYVLMNTTVIMLFVRMRTLGSRFTLAIMLFLTAAASFILALLTAEALGVRMDVLLLSEALPFLVITVGFDKPYTLTKAVLAAEFDRPVQKRGETRHEAQLRHGLDRVLPFLMRDYMLELSILGMGAISNVSGLREFSIFAMFIVVYDGAFLFTFYSALLSLKLLVVRMRRNAIANKAKNSGILDKMTAGALALDEPVSSVAHIHEGEEATFNPNMARVKLFLVRAL